MYMLDDLRLGVLLVESRLVDAVWIQRALTLSKCSGFQLGRSLVLLGALTDDVLLSALEAQRMIKLGQLDRQTASIALRVVKRRGWTLADALVGLECDSHCARGTKLGELLLDSDVVDTVSCDFALRLADASGLPLGVVLMALDEIEQVVLDLALDIQKELRDGNVERADAVLLIKYKAARAFLNRGKSAGADIRLPELLVMSHVLSQAEMLSLTRESRRKDMSLGQILVVKDKISEPLLIAAIYLQNMIWQGKILAGHAAMALDEMRRCGLDARETFARAGICLEEVAKDLTACDFLRAAGHLSRLASAVILDQMVNEDCQVDIKVANRGYVVKAKSGKDGFPAGVESWAIWREKLISFLPYEDAGLIDTAVVLSEMVRSEMMTVESALIRFKLIKLSRDLDDASWMTRVSAVVA